MALQDFIKTLEAQEDSDTVYSKKPEPTVRIIPPQGTKVSSQKTITLKDSTKVIPPHNEPVIIKFTNLNIRKKEPEKESKKPTNIKMNLSGQNNKENNQIKNQPQSDEPKKQPKQETDEDIIEKLFLQSDTPLSKKQIWIESYKGANQSKKNTELVDKVRRGRFTIDENNKIILLSEYVTADKSIQSILNDQWLKKDN